MRSFAVACLRGPGGSLHKRVSVDVYPAWLRRSGENVFFVRGCTPSTVDASKLEESEETVSGYATEDAAA